MWIDNDIKFPLERFVHLLTQFVIAKAKEAELAHRNDRSFQENLARQFTPSAYALHVENAFFEPGSKFL